MDIQEMIAEHDNGDEWPTANTTLKEDIASKVYWPHRYFKDPMTFATVLQGLLAFSIGVAIGLVILNH